MPPGCTEKSDGTMRRMLRVALHLIQLQQSYRSKGIMHRSTELKGEWACGVGEGLAQSIA
jgi:hypothetical protein